LLLIPILFEIPYVFIKLVQGWQPAMNSINSWSHPYDFPDHVYQTPSEPGTFYGSSQGCQNSMPWGFYGMYAPLHPLNMVMV
jgi:hypothetical protein